MLPKQDNHEYRRELLTRKLTKAIRKTGPNAKLNALAETHPTFGQRLIEVSSSTSVQLHLWCNKGGRLPERIFEHVPGGINEGTGSQTHCPYWSQNRMK